ncbi:MAG: PAS domain S-box protein, partial [Pseudomonadota bacterium]
MNTRTTPKDAPHKPEDLRRRAEARLKSRTTGLKKPSFKEARDLVQELQIYQVELEIQNDQLRQTQEELETALTKYTDLYDFAPLAYLTLDDRGCILEANLTAARLLGTERSRLVQQPLAPFIRPEDKQKFRAYLGAVVQGQPAPPLELHLQGKGGAEVAAQLDGLLVPDAAGHPQVRTSLIDITARRRAEEGRKNQMHFTETLLDTIPSPVYYKDAAGRYLGCNRAFEEFWGKRREEVIGKDVYEM